MADITLPPCETEDSQDCFWDAIMQGNGLGQSFFTYAGETTEIVPIEGQFISTVTVNPHANTYTGGGSWYGVHFEQYHTPADQPGPDLAPTGLADPTTIIALGVILVMFGIWGAINHRRQS